MKVIFKEFLRWTWRAIPFVAFPVWIYVFGFAVIGWLILNPVAWIMIILFVCHLFKKPDRVFPAVQWLSLFMILRLIHGGVGYYLAEWQSLHWEIVKPLRLPAGFANAQIGGCWDGPLILASEDVLFVECKEDKPFTVNGVEYSPGIYHTVLDTSRERCRQLLSQKFPIPIGSESKIIGDCAKFERVDGYSANYLLEFDHSAKRDGWYYGLSGHMRERHAYDAKTGEVVATQRNVWINRFHLMAFVESLGVNYVFGGVSFASNMQTEAIIAHMLLIDPDRVELRQSIPNYMMNGIHHDRN